MTDTTSNWIESLRRSWLLKLAWIIAPFGAFLALALFRHASRPEAAWPSLMGMLILFGGLAVSIAFALIERRQRRASLRRLSPLQRLQMSDEANLAPLSETLRISDPAPIETLPRPLLSAMAFWGARLSKPVSTAVLVLDLTSIALLLAMVVMDDPLGALSRRTGAPLLPYWPVFITLFVTAIAIRTIGYLAQMHRYYVAQAAPSGRRPFAAL